MSARRASLEVAQGDDGWTTRLRGANGKIVMSSGSQVYASRDAAIRAVTIAAEAVGWSTEVINGTVVIRPRYRDERTKP